LVLILIRVNLISAQQLKIAGKVLDINTHRAIPYTNIYIKETLIGTISDFAGKFALTVPKPNDNMVLIIQHINYDVYEIKLGKAESSQDYYLQPRVIPLPEIEIEARGEKLDIAKDLPQTISLIKASDFEIRGYVDAGDLLRTDHSVQVEEELSGKKTISIRGGNADDVVVLYNGMKMNSGYDNIFDFSLIDLEDIERFEVIKGSNTVLYGSEAFSGVVNIVPKIQQDYLIRFQQRIGTYDSGNWGLHLYKNYKNFHASYQLRQGAAKRKFSDVEDDSQFLENSATHHTVNVEHNFSKGPGDIPKNSLGVMYIQSASDYINHRYIESLKNTNKMVGLRYEGDIWKITDLNLNLSQRWLDEAISLSNNFGWVDREINDQSINVHAEKAFKFNSLDFLFAYQFENARLDFFDERSDYEIRNMDRSTAALNRKRHGLISIIKVHAPSGSDILKNVDFDLSFRNDNVRDNFNNLYLSGTADEMATGNEWNESMIKFASYFSGYQKSYAFDIFMNIGTNVKFPTLSQIISSKIFDQPYSTTPPLKPEKNKSVEIGIVLKRDLRQHPVVYGWQISGNYMKNHYDNKFRPYYIFGIPFAIYDNVPLARISGFETKSSVYFLRKKVTVELGLSHYSISDKSAFPFKYDMKRTLNFIIDHAGYSFQLHWFKEGEQTGWIRQISGGFVQVLLPDFANVDLHLSKTFVIGRLKLFGNISARNILNDKEVVLEGLALRDRRLYLTVGAQY